VTYYGILKVGKKAGLEEIKKAYRRLALQYHPDSVPDDKKRWAHNKFVKISEAYATLADSEKRAEYDLFLKDRRREFKAPDIRSSDVEQRLREILGDLFDEFFDEEALQVLRRRAARIKQGKPALTPEETRKEVLLFRKIILVYLLNLFIFAFIGFKIFRIWGLIIGAIIGIVLSCFIASGISDRHNRRDPLLRKFYKKIDNL
jgi:curved DNA-binding protein CbpA